MSHARAGAGFVTGWEARRYNGEWRVYEQWPTGLAYQCAHLFQRGALRCIERRRALTAREIKPKTPRNRSIKIDLEGSRT